MSSPPFKVKAVFEYASGHDDDLNFPNGQIITVTEEEDADWYIGEYTDAQGERQTGLFPRNFVERYEPEVPSRPTRASRPKSSIQSPPTKPAEFGVQDESTAVPLPAPAQPKLTPAPAAAPAPAPAPAPATASSLEPVAPEEPAQSEREEPRAPLVSSDTPPKPKPAGGKGPPPPVAGKSNAFKDRIAAFNKQDTPVLPFKPGSSPANYAIKKPFVAPPPSRNAYVPPPPKPEPIHKIYRRDEDPEIAERIAEDQAAAESAGLTANPEPVSKDADVGEEDAPKPQSLKDRIALLQKQQAEQAQRRAADAASKEKPKRPAKKRTESSEQVPTEDAALDEPERALPIRGSQDSTDQARHAANRVLSPPVPMPLTREPDIMSDGNEADMSAAGETTEANEDTSDQEEPESQRSIPEPIRAHRAPSAPAQEPDVGEEEDTTEGQSEEDEMDAETRRRLELRERMAKISGGMGMAGMFGPQPGMAIAPPAKKASKSRERRQSQDDAASPPSRPMIPVPGMMPPVARPHAQESELAPGTGDDLNRSLIEEDEPQEMSDADDDVKPPPLPPAKESRSSLDGRGLPPPVPGERPVPAPPPPSSRPMAPAPPSRPPQSPGVSDEQLRRRRSSIETPRAVPPPIPSTRASVDSSRSPKFGNESEASMSGGIDTRPGRAAPPPLPPMPPVGSPPMQSRAPPPPPPMTTTHYVEEPDEGESEYEGDYDTDIASSEKHKAALKTHARQPSLDESTTAEDTPIHQSPPPLPPMSTQSAHRTVPPPPPLSAPKGRTSTEIPRAAPPPVPPSRPPPADEEVDDGFDNYKRYQESSRTAPPPPPPAAAPVPIPQSDPIQDSSDDLYQVPTKKSIDVPRTAPPPPMEPSPRIPDMPRGGARQSMEANRNLSRKSLDASRPSIEGYMASDVDLAENSQWWAQPNAPPPVFQNRNDVLFEVEESSSSKRGGKTTISKDVYALFMDYSQTIITARFDKADPADTTLEQRHEPPPPRMRQDQLESAWQSYGAKIAEQATSLASSKKDMGTVGDGSPFALALEVIRGLPSALLPVGTRAYGAPVYANIGNASVQQFDEIRPGDLISFRNAKLQGKHGGLHQKYSVDVGVSSNGHVAVVVEWDGTKKKVRALEQVRDDKGRVKVRIESYRLGDLKSGEVRVWRVVGRDWVGWDK